MMKRPVEDGLSLLVGAGVGMALMYLLDPAEGFGRREQLGRAARERLARAGNAATTSLDHLHEAVDRAAQSPAVQLLAARAADAAKGVYHEIGDHVSSAVRDAQQEASDAAQGIHSRMGGRLDELRGKAAHWASDWKQTAQSRYGKWLNQSSRALGRDEDHRYVGQTVCALGSLALGAGAVYLFDPDQGHNRRARLIDRTAYAVRETGDFFRKAGRRLVTRSRGVARTAKAQAKGAVSNLGSSNRRSQPTQGRTTRAQPADESAQSYSGT
jgi:hypothetical protein